MLRTNVSVRARVYISSLSIFYIMRYVERQEGKITRCWCFLILLGLAQIDSKLFSSLVEKERDMKIGSTRRNERLKRNCRKIIIYVSSTRILQSPLDSTTLPRCYSCRVSEIVQIYIYIYISTYIYIYIYIYIYTYTYTYMYVVYT